MKNNSTLAKSLIIIGLLWCAVGVLLIIFSNILIQIEGNEFLLLEPKHLRDALFTALLLFPGLALYLAGRFISRDIEK